MIDLVSLHILKTGGMSFLDILIQEYGEEYVYRYIENETKFKKIRRKIVLNTISKKTKVLHGHFIFRDVAHIVKKNNSKVVVWFRDPIERVISRYYFLMKKIEENPNQPKISFKNDTLLEFAKRPSQQNMMSRFVHGIDLEELFFFGFLETFNDDMANLANKLGWESYQVPHNNSNTKYRKKHENSISEEVRHELTLLNKKDIDLYNRAQKLKNK